MLRCHMLPVPLILIWLHADNISILPIHGVPKCDVCITYIYHTLPTHTMNCYLIYILYVSAELQYLYWCDAMAIFIPYICCIYI